MMPSQPAAASTESQLDPQQIALLRGLRNGALLPQLLRTYRDQATTQIAVLCQAAARSDHAALRITAHTLKSASFNVGATHIGQLCAQLEAKAMAHDMQDCAALCTTLQERYALLLSEIVEHTPP